MATSAQTVDQTMQSWQVFLMVRLPAVAMSRCLGFYFSVCMAFPQATNVTTQVGILTVVGAFSALAFALAAISDTAVQKEEAKRAGESLLLTTFMLGVAFVLRVATTTLFTQSPPCLGAIGAYVIAAPTFGLAISASLIAAHGLHVGTLDAINILWRAACVHPRFNDLI